MVAKLVVLVLVCASACTSQGSAARPFRAPGAVAPWCALPVAEPVIDGFRPPPERWLAGNRGLTFDTRPGETVWAVSAGIVTFAGPVAGAVHVTVRRPDEADVTYSFLARSSVRRGDPVHVGDEIGVSGIVKFQLGERRGDTYVDPSHLVIDGCGSRRAVLVPLPQGVKTTVATRPEQLGS